MKNNEQRIVIIGFMGTGKSTVAQALAHELQCEWIDLDALIEKHERRSPDEIIRQDGEEKFREIEAGMLLTLMGSGLERVIAAGGGAWTIARNRKTLAEHGAFTIWLDAPFELCWKRIEAEGETRPLASSREVALKLYIARRSLYQLASLRIAIDVNDSPEQIAQRIATRVLERNTSEVEQ